MVKSLDYIKHESSLLKFFKNLEKVAQKEDVFNSVLLSKSVKKYLPEIVDSIPKFQLVEVYRKLVHEKKLEYSDEVMRLIRMKPTRTQSGLAPVTVLTKPFPCPGKCIFCPNDVRMPKSYLADEPGAQRAERNWFDPYLQTYNRLLAMSNIGHTVDKVELIILGGTWSFYPEPYQIWFIKECFRALNDFGYKDDRNIILSHYQKLQHALIEKKMFTLSDDPQENKKNTKQYEIDGRRMVSSYNQTISSLYVAPEKLGGFDVYQTASWSDLETQQQINERAKVRSVGLVIETRPDNISKSEVKRIRRLGCTKAQIGVQSLQDEVLSKNKRGHDVAATRKAFRLLRQAGFKIHAHWMANLYGSSVEADIKDFKNLFSDADFFPDELKIYPCSLIGSAELMKYFQQKLWKPYSYEELLKVVTECILATPAYCRLTRVIRDIPSTDIVEGNKLTNFRQIAEQKLAQAGLVSQDIRAREVRNLKYKPEELRYAKIIYQTSVSTEYFLQYVLPVSQDRKQEKIVAFLRLSLPKLDLKPIFQELESVAIIREIHVYGQVVGIGKSGKNSQHLGFGTKLIKKARAIVSKQGYKKMAVISAIGTKEYYRKQGFEDGQLYQHLILE